MKLLYPLAKRFIAGHDFASAKPVINELLKEGYEVSIDYLGELSHSREDCVNARNQYLKIINHYRKKKIDISIKPSQLGLFIHHDICYAHLSEIANTAKAGGHTIRLDMECSKSTDLTINMAISLNKRYGNVGVALQANLFRTAKDIIKLVENKVSIRLVKGAYKENEEIAYQELPSIKSSFFDYCAYLKSRKSYKPAVATHDEELLEDVLDIIPDPKYFDYEFLYGIRRDLQRKLKNDGYNVRVYVPFGTDWLPYTLRRLKEFKNLKFVIKNIIKEWWNGR